MGYKTRHRLYIEPPLTEEQIALAFEPDRPWIDEEDGEDDEPWFYVPEGMSFCIEAPNKKGYCAPMNKGKWSEDPDMLKLSAAYPEVKFTLQVGDDIDSAPEYVSYYYGGKKETVSPRVMVPPSTLW